MAEVSTDVLKQNGLEVVHRWYHSPHGVDLFLWHGADQDIIKIQLSILGSVVDWSLAGGVRTGIVVEEEQSGSVNKIDASERIQFDGDLVPETLKYGLEVLKAMTCLKPKDEAFLMSRLIGSTPKISGWKRFLLAIKSYLR